MYTTKEFIDEFENFSKSERISIFLDLVSDISFWYIKKAYRKEETSLLKDLFSLMKTKQFLKTFKKAAKADPDYCMEFCTVVGDFLENAKRLPEEFVPGDDIKEAYIEILTNLLKKRSAELSKITLLPPDLIINLLVVMPTANCISSNKFIGIQVNRVNRKIYNTVATMEEVDSEDFMFTKKQFKKLYTDLFGKEALIDVSLSILLEGKEVIKHFNKRQMKVFNAITEFALDIINEQKKDAIRDIVSEYISRRSTDAKRDRDYARRIKLSEIDSDEYKKLAKIVGEIKEEIPDVSKYL